jgi:hypothetical protein
MPYRRSIEIIRNFQENGLKLLLENWQNVGLDRVRRTIPGAHTDLGAFVCESAGHAAGRVTHRGGYFGWVLRLLQGRRLKPREFQDLLEQVVEKLETMPEADRLRWLELLSYIHALVDHGDFCPRHLKAEESQALTAIRRGLASGVNGTWTSKTPLR